MAVPWTRKASGGLVSNAATAASMRSALLIPNRKSSFRSRPSAQPLSVNPCRTARTLSADCGSFLVIIIAATTRRIRFGRLCPRRQRPCRHAAQKRDEIAPFQLTVLHPLSLASEAA